MPINPYNKYIKQYQTSNVTTATPEKLMLMLFDAAIQFLQKAKTAIEQKDYKTRSENIDGARKILRELMRTIDLENGNDVSKSLFRLYNRMAMKLIKANVQRNAPLIDEVLDDFVNIRWGFQKAVEIKSGISSVEEVMKQQATNRQNGSLPPAPPYEQALELQMEAALGQLPADNTLTEENSKQEHQVEEQKLQEDNTQIAQPEIGKSEDLSKNLQDNFVSDSEQHVTAFDAPQEQESVSVDDLFDDWDN